MTRVSRPEAVIMTGVAILAGLAATLAGQSGWVHWLGVAVSFAGWILIWAAMDLAYRRGRRDEFEAWEESIDTVMRLDEQAIIEATGPRRKRPAGEGYGVGQ